MTDQLIKEKNQNSAMRNLRDAESVDDVLNSCKTAVDKILAEATTYMQRPRVSTSASSEHYES